ncbi:hypothetical protein ACH5RR_005220 [Cinchona calisaya]|uniref:CBM20 domain-containing protein n=1 Tax=Cinchona calisaya TaxID=153742 RepID=A0ABD3AKL1_9GENT
MEALAASSARLFVDNQTKRDKYYYNTNPSRRAAAAAAGAAGASLSTRRPEICFLGYLKKHVNLSFSSSLPLSLQRESVQPISSAQTCAANEEIETKDSTQFKTVHVKFQLQRECSFGQQFLMVGEDLMFGLWDPSSAIPLNWSEGHVWTVEMDIPCDKVMKYKFILKGGDDTILWQPGPDRILQTWETRNTITVCEDWDNAELQIIKEEDPVNHPLTESIDDDSELLKVTEDLLQASGDSGGCVNEEHTSTNGYQPLTKEPFSESEQPTAIVAENITEKNGKKAVEANGFPGPEFMANANEALTLGIKDYQNSGRSGSSENLIVSENEKNLDSSAAIPVLVPGLPPIPTVETEESSVSKADKHISTDSSLGSNNAQEFNVPELNSKEEPGIDLAISKEETQKLLNDKLELHDNGHIQKPQLFEETDQRPNNNGVDDGVLENDIQWGRRTLQQLLMNLGLL